VKIADGASRRLSVALSNPGGSVAKAETYAANVYSIVNGGFAARLAGQAETGVTTWLDYPEQAISLAPGHTQRLSFTVSVPANASPVSTSPLWSSKNRARPRPAGRRPLPG